eukprot:scaffold19467_cov90-Isochrysis_galbana.AAC.2
MVRASEQRVKRLHQSNRECRASNSCIRLNSTRLRSRAARPATSPETSSPRTAARLAHSFSTTRS